MFGSRPAGPGETPLKRKAETKCRINLLSPVEISRFNETKVGIIALLCGDFCNTRQNFVQKKHTIRKKLKML